VTRADGRADERTPRAEGLASARGRLLGRTVRGWALVTARIAVAAGLAVDAYVHLDLAPVYAEGGGVINEGVLFRVEAAVALLAAIAVLFTGRRICYLAGFAVAVSALALMLVSRYVDMGAIGPLPNLYDPVWFPEKLLAAFAEGAASLIALLGFVLCTRPRKVPAATAPRSPSL
jgi:hypothetical protein